MDVEAVPPPHPATQGGQDGSSTTALQDQVPPPPPDVSVQERSSPRTQQDEVPPPPPEASVKASSNPFDDQSPRPTIDVQPQEGSPGTPPTTAPNPFDEQTPQATVGVEAPGGSAGAPPATAPNPFHDEGVGAAQRPQSTPALVQDARSSMNSAPHMAFPMPAVQPSTMPSLSQSEAAKRAAQGMFQGGKHEAEQWARTVPCRFVMVAPPALLMLIVIIPCTGTCHWLNPRPRTIAGLLWTVIIPLAPFVHSSWTYLWVDLASWICLGWRLSDQGAGTFVSLSLFVLFVPAVLTWVTGSPLGMYTGMAGILFGIIGFNASVIYSKYQHSILTRHEVVMFMIFDVLLGGVWWCFSYMLPQYSWVLVLWGFVCGVFFSALSHAGAKIDAEKIPLLRSTERAVEAKSRACINRLCA